MAERSTSNVAVLLGRAVAHELGHLLLKTNDHSEGGLMRAKAYQRTSKWKAPAGTLEASAEGGSRIFPARYYPTKPLTG